MSIRIERSKTSTNTAPGTLWTLCFCWEVALHMLSDWTLYVALSRLCAYCMRCSKWKWGLKGRCICLGVIRPFLVTFKPQKSNYSVRWKHLALVFLRLIYMLFLLFWLLFSALCMQVLFFMVYALFFCALILKQNWSQLRHHIFLNMYTIS